LADLLQNSYPERIEIVFDDAMVASHGRLPATNLGPIHFSANSPSRRAFVGTQQWTSRGRLPKPRSIKLRKVMLGYLLDTDEAMALLGREGGVFGVE